MVEEKNEGAQLESSNDTAFCTIQKAAVMALHRERRTLVKSFLGESILCTLALQGQSTIKIPREVFLDELRRDLTIEIFTNPKDDTVEIHFRLKGNSYAWRQDVADEADYEIIEEPKALPPSPKLLKANVNPD